MVEYDEGFLMAVDSLKRTGTSIDLYTYSTGPVSYTHLDVYKRQTKSSELPTAVAASQQPCIRPCK